MNRHKIITLFFFFVMLGCSKDETENPKINTLNIGLILYLPFDGNTNDYSGSKNDGIDFTSQNFVKGKHSQALDFNGYSDYIVLKNTLISYYGLSISFWVKTRGAFDQENNGSIVSKYNMAANTRCFMIYSFGAYDTRSDNRLSAAFYKYGYSSSVHDYAKSCMTSSEISAFPDPTLWTIANPKRLNLNEWTHCVVNVTWTELQIWINGVLCTKKLREHLFYFDTFDESIYIGNNYAVGQGSNNHFNGILDELRIYNRGLTEEEIKILFRE